MDRRAFIAAIAAIPAAALAGLRSPTVLTFDGFRIPPLEASGGYLVPEPFAKEMIAKLYAIPPELIGEPNYSVSHYLEAMNRQLIKAVGKLEGHTI